MYQAQYNHEETSFDRQTPDSSDGIGSSLSSSSVSPSPSNDFESRPTSPNQQYYSTPANYYQNDMRLPVNYFNPQQTRYYPTNCYNYPQYYQYNTLNTSNFNDSTYYSRNSSFEQSSCIQTPIQTKPTTKPFLKFSIEAILAKPENIKQEIKSNETTEEFSQEFEEPNLLDESKQVASKGKKRKQSRKSIESNSNKRMRTIFTQEQLDKLEIEFNRQQYMVGSERSFLASSLNLTEAQVKIWFQNRRIKMRKSQTGQVGQGDRANSNEEDSLNQSCSNESYADE